jgi:ABC-type sugar transport system substrate-binding protein
VIRKIAAIALTLILTSPVLAGCGQSGEVKVRSARKGQIAIGFSQVGESSRWRAANTRSIEESAGIENARLVVAVGDTQEKQIADIRDFIRRKVDVIVFSPAVENGWDEVLKEARQAKIPVILTDRAIATADPSLYVSSIGSNFTTEGSSAAAWIRNEFRSAGSVNIVVLEGTPGSAPAVQRKAGFLEALQGHEKFKIIASPSANFSRAEGKAVMKGLLRAHPDIDVLFAHNDDMGLGAMAAIEAAGRRPGEDIKIVTIDAIRDGLVALSKRKINFIVECNPLIGPQLMDLVRDVFLGIPVPRRVDTNEVVFFPESVEEYLKDREY